MANLHHPAQYVATTVEDGAHFVVWIEHGVANSFSRSVLPAATRAVRSGRHLPALVDAVRAGQWPLADSTQLLRLGLVHDSWTGPTTRPGCCVTGCRFRVA